MKLHSKLETGSWFFLFFLTMILLPVMYYHSAILPANRMSIPNNQYFFFAITLVTSLIFLRHLNFNTFIQVIKNRYFILLFALFLVTAVSALLGWTPYYGLRLLSIILLTSIPFIIAGLYAPKNPVFFSLPFLFYGLIILFGTFFTAYIGPIQIGHIFIDNYLWGTRWSFWFNQANGLGVIITLTVTTLFYFLSILPKKTWYRTAVFIAMLLCAFILLKSGSRSALLWLCSSVIIYNFAFFLEHVHSTSKRKRALLLILFFAGAVLFCLGAFYTLMHFVRPGSGVIKNVLSSQSSVAQSISVSHSSTDHIMNRFTSSRWNVWLRYFHQIKLTPFFGYGFGAEEVFLHHQPNIITGNVYIRMLGESGIFSLLFFLVIFISGVYYAAKTCMKKWRSNPAIARFALFVLMALIGIGLEQMGDAFILRIEEINYLFFFFVSAAWSLGFYHAE